MTINLIQIFRQFIEWDDLNILISITNNDTRIMYDNLLDHKT